jgi:transcriptional regulator with XRE-family HTH domain
MASRKTLREIVARNIRLVMEEHDLNTREVQKRSGVPQRTVHSVVNNQSAPTLTTIEKLCSALLISPVALMVENAPMSVLQSRRTRWLLGEYARMTPLERQKVEDAVLAIGDGVVPEIAP